MALANALTITQKITFLLALVLCLSTIVSLYPLPTYNEEKMHAIAQFPIAKQQSQLEIEQRFQSLMRDQWIIWLLPFFGLVGTLVAAIALFYRLRYWPAITLLVSLYVLTLTVPPLFSPSAGLQVQFIYFTNFFPAKPLDGIWGLWNFFMCPLLYGVLLLLALFAMFNPTRDKLRESNP